VRAFLDLAEGHAQRDGALRVDHRQLRRLHGVEGAEQIHFAVVLCGCVAHHCNLDVHSFSYLICE
jgi:hypothetical protein